MTGSPSKSSSSVGASVVTTGLPIKSSSSVGAVEGERSGSENEKGVGGTDDCEDAVPGSPPHASEGVVSAREDVCMDQVTVFALREPFLLIMRRMSPGCTEPLVSAT